MYVDIFVSAFDNQQSQINNRGFRSFLFGITLYHCCVITVVMKTKTPENQDLRPENVDPFMILKQELRVTL